MRPLLTMRRAISDPLLLGSAFPVRPGGPDTWISWKAMALAIRGEPLMDVELEAFRNLTKRETSPTEPVEELVIIKSRRSGGTTYCAAMVIYQAALIDYSDVLGVGEKATALLLAPSQRQAEVAFGRVCGIFDNSPLLSSMIVGRTADTLTLNNSITIEIGTASLRSTRGLTLATCVIDEACFLGTLEAGSRHSDVEITNSVRPALLTTKGQLILASTPYAQTGEVFTSFERYYGKNGPILVAKGTWKDTNPTLDEAFVARAMERDPVAARAEYLGEFRSDVSGFIDRDLLLVAVDEGVTERPPTGNHIAFADAASASMRPATATPTPCRSATPPTTAP